MVHRRLLGIVILLLLGLVLVSLVNADGGEDVAGDGGNAGDEKEGGDGGGTKDRADDGEEVDGGAGDDGRGGGDVGADVGGVNGADDGGGDAGGGDGGDEGGAGGDVGGAGDDAADVGAGGDEGEAARDDGGADVDDGGANIRLPAGDDGAAGDGGRELDDTGAGGGGGDAGDDGGADAVGAGGDNGGADDGGAGGDNGGADDGVPGGDNGEADDGGAGENGGAGVDDGGADTGVAAADDGGAGDGGGGAGDDGGADDAGAGGDNGGAGADDGGADLGGADEVGAGDGNAEGGADVNGDAEEYELTKKASNGGTSVTMGSKMFSGDDIPSTGKCKDEIEEHCKEMTGGARHYVDCITRRVISDLSEPDNGVPISDSCKAEIRLFKIEMYKNISMDTKMEKACKKDIAKFCDNDVLYPEPGSIVACLREVNQVDNISEDCKEEVVRAQLDAADDFKLDPQLNALCSEEAERLCKGVQPGGGRIQDCLRENRLRLAWDCQAELFRQEVENADDIRLNVRLFKACLNDKKKFCPDVVPGDARVKDCLEQHRLQTDFSASCKLEFDHMMERRASDFRLDSTLRKYCKQDITQTCYPDAEDITDVANWDAKVIQCLQDFREDLKDPKCRQQVHQLTKRSAEDIRFDKPLTDACSADWQTHCKDTANGTAQVFGCLQLHRDALQEGCRSALFDQEIRWAENIDFKFPLKQACQRELKLFCSKVPYGHGAVIKCLQEKVNEADMGEDCRAEIKQDQLRTAEDYRLNYRLNKACSNDVQKMCLRTCEKTLELGAITCGGTVLKCLSENKDKIEAEECKKEVFSFQKAVASDIALDLPLQRACKGDLARFCSEVSKDHTRTLRCLRRKRDSLSEECRAEERRFSIMEASDIRLTPTLMNACGQELETFCQNVPPTDGQAFKCLQSKLEELGMGTACKAEMNLQEIRHSSDYRLDVRVRKECEADVPHYCDGVDKGKEGHALVLRCMVNKFKKLSAPCATEVQYAVRMALWQYSKGAELTKACDEAVESKCSSLDAKPIDGVVIGVYGQCLLSHKLKDVDPECRKLVKIVYREGAHVGTNVDENKLRETLLKLAELQVSSASVPQSAGLVLTGWLAKAAVLSVALLALAVAYVVFQYFVRPNRNYTLVVKGGNV